MLSIYIVYQVYIVARCSNTNSHPVISYKIVQRTGAFARKNRITRTMCCRTTEWVYESKRWSLANGTREFSWQTEYTVFYRILRAEMYEKSRRLRYGVTQEIYQMPLFNLGQWRCDKRVRNVSWSSIKGDTPNIYFPLYASETWLWFTALRLHRENTHINVRVQLTRDETRTCRVSRKGFGSCLKGTLRWQKFDTIANWEWWRSRMIKTQRLQYNVTWETRFL